VVVVIVGVMIMIASSNAVPRPVALMLVDQQHTRTPNCHKPPVIPKTAGSASWEYMARMLSGTCMHLYAPG
jgi:hypothetical protein